MILLRKQHSKHFISCLKKFTSKQYLRAIVLRLRSYGPWSVASNLSWDLGSINSYCILSSSSQHKFITFWIILVELRDYFNSWLDLFCKWTWLCKFYCKKKEKKESMTRMVASGDLPDANYLFFIYCIRKKLNEEEEVKHHV